MSSHNSTSPAARRLPRVTGVGRPPRSPTDSDPSEHTPSLPSGPSRPAVRPQAPAPVMREIPVWRDVPVRRDPVPCPVPLRCIPPVRSEASVTGPLFQHSHLPISYFEYERVTRERDYLMGQNIEMRNMRSAETSAARDRHRVQEQLGEMQMRLWIVITLVDTRMYGMEHSAEGITVAGLLSIVEYMRGDIREIVEPESREQGPGQP